MQKHTKQILDILEAETVSRRLYEDALDTIHALEKENNGLEAKYENLLGENRELRQEREEQYHGEQILNYERCLKQGREYQKTGNVSAFSRGSRGK